MQIKYPNGDTFSGAHKLGVKNGYGRYKYRETGVEYIGEWKNNERHGRGEIVFKNENNARFVGEFDQDNMVHGEYIDGLGNVFKSLKQPQG